MKWDYGTVLRTIRKSKGMSQQTVCGDFLSRTTLSRIENNKEYPSIHHFAHILRQLDMSFAEFDYICHAYQPSERSKLIYQFENFSGQLMTPEKLQDFAESCYHYLQRYDDIGVERMAQQARIALSIAQRGDDDLTKLLAQELWEELERYDTWYLADYRKLNLLFPIIPSHQLEEFVTKILLSLEKYKDFKEIRVSQFAFLANLATVLLKKNDLQSYKRVMELVYELAHESKRIDYVGLADVRMGMLRQDRTLVDRGLTLLRAAEMDDMAEKLEKDLVDYWDLFTG